MSISLETQVEDSIIKNGGIATVLEMSIDVFNSTDRDKKKTIYRCVKRMERDGRLEIKPKGKFQGYVILSERKKPRPVTRRKKKIKVPPGIAEDLNNTHQACDGSWGYL